MQAINVFLSKIYISYFLNSFKTNQMYFSIVGNELYFL